MERKPSERSLANQVDLALLDYHMPHMNGDVAAAQMKTCKADVPVALMSADHFPVLANLKAVDAFVCKSEAIPKVLDIVDELLSRRVLFQPLEGWEAGNRSAVRWFLRGAWGSLLSFRGDLT